MCHLGLQHLPCVFHCSNLCFVFSYWSLEANFLVFHSAQLKATKSRRHSSGVPSTPSCLIYVIFCFLPISCPVCRVGVHHFCTKCALFAPGSHHCAQARETCSITQQRGVGKNILGFVEFLPPLPRTPVNYHLKPLYVLRQLWRWLSCILSLPMATTMCIITLCTIPLLCTIASARNTLAVLYLIQPQGRHRQQLEKKRCYARSTNKTLLTMSFVYKAHPCTYSQLCIV